jgi:4a-hydroxytetrahydrobiopterin dehydratase
MTRTEFEPLLAQLPDWQVEDDRKLVATFRFKNWAQAQAFVVAAGEIAEAEAHHPDLTLSWGKVGAEIYTHKIKGLSEGDFVLAAKYSRLYREQVARSDEG